MNDIYYLSYKSEIRKYEGKRITVRGIIAEIAECKNTRFYVRLFEHQYSANYEIACYFSSEWENTILTLKNGQRITVKGKFQWDNDYPDLNDCEILRDRIISTAQETSGVSIQPKSISTSEIVSVGRVFREYEANPIAAKRKYEGRRITVQGKAYNIVGNEQELWFRLGKNEKDYYKLECYFLPEWESIIHTFEEGQTITVNGEWQYFTDSKADLHDCEIVSAV